MGVEAKLEALAVGGAERLTATVVHVTRLAQGGMGTVDLCVRRAGSFERLYAIKRPHSHLRADAAARAMFLDEARIAGGLRHANVVPVLDFGEDDDGPYMVMDYIEGVSLSRVMQHHAAGDAIPTTLAIAMIAQVARGLHAAHELVAPDGALLALVHRDVSPPNILVGRDGSVRVTDFGISKALGSASHTTTGLLKGKAGYMSPEQLRFEAIDRRSDLFAVGIVMFELLTTERLYCGDDAAAVARRILDEPVPDIGDRRPELPPELVELSFRLLAKHRDDRPATAAEVADALDAIGAETSVDIARYVEARFGADLEREREHVQALLSGLAASPRYGRRKDANDRLRTSTFWTRGRAPKRMDVVFTAALAVPVIASALWPEAPEGQGGAFDVLTFAADWSTPNAIHWTWQVSGDVADFHAWEIQLARSAAALDTGEGLLVFDGTRNPELHRFLLRNTTGEEPVDGTITDGLEPSSDYYARLFVLDTAGGRSKSTNVAVKHTGPVPTVGLAIYTDTFDAGVVLPSCYVASETAPYRGTAHYQLENHCDARGDARCSDQAVVTPALLCWENLQWQGMSLPIPQPFGPSQFADAYVEVAVAVDTSSASSETEGHGWWSNVRLRAAGKLWWYEKLTIRADGNYRVYQLPLARFGLDATSLGTTIEGLDIGSAWAEGSVIRVDEAWIRW